VELVSESPCECGDDVSKRKEITIIMKDLVISHGGELILKMGSCGLRFEHLIHRPFQQLYVRVA